MSELLAAFEVPGRPRTKGSLKVITPRGQKPRLIEDHPHSKPWRNRMINGIKALQPLWPLLQEPYAGPVAIVADFSFQRLGPTAAALPWPTLNGGAYAVGDLDKLTRNLLDALTDAKIIADDSLVCSMEVNKIWGPEAGVKVRIYALGQ